MAQEISSEEALKSKIVRIKDDREFFFLFARGFTGRHVQFYRERAWR